MNDGYRLYPAMTSKDVLKILRRLDEPTMPLIPLWAWPLALGVAFALGFWKEWTR